MITLTFKVTADEARRIRTTARRENMTVSEFLRCRAAMLPAVPPKPRRVRCPFTGARVFAGMAGQAPLTTEAVREMTGDFP